ncbi:dihydropteroate synthase [Pelomonas saccharophila]|uniref:Dihydropteroate synthase n=1 Tax=Roseateles saccharophilus TaxID=304 RepID=A0ABU1YQX0_ROSSA|nr:dihydropteroate synthase [Roseateles saccharophilus]MDR7271257.1 dihydropteroate synthase [Roseateles saccharophilus]
MHWQTRRFRIDLSRPRVMGIVNVTPDSFSDGGQHDDSRTAIAHCERLVAEGADILDIGGESTRPGAPRVDADSEWARIDKVLAAAVTLGVPVSIDTCKPEVMRRALDAGADIINDVQALQMPGALAAVAGSGAGVCLMHMRGEPASMMDLAVYGDVVAEVAAFLARRAQAARDSGIPADCIALDPGYGFAKKAEHNLQLLAGQPRLAELGYPLLVGWSRKRTLGDITGRAVDQRLPASLAAALKAVSLGANVLRVHDVAATVDALKVWAAVDAATILATE